MANPCAKSAARRIFPGRLIEVQALSVWMGWSRQTGRGGLVVDLVFEQAQPARRRHRIADGYGVRIGVGGFECGMQPPLQTVATYMRPAYRSTDMLASTTASLYVPAQESRNPA
jgi:hypothetical protein